MKIRRAKERGHVELDWLDSWNGFSFGSYYDPEHMGFRGLRVLNDDTVAPASGFEPHPHRDMEIVTWVVEGALEHRDSMGNGSVIRPGDLQRMSAGTGVVHSEMNPSSDQPVRLLQIWLQPLRRGVPPSYAQKHFPLDEWSGRFRLVASRGGRDDSVDIDADASIHAARLAAGERAALALDPERHVWLQVVSGDIELAAGDENVRASAGDGLAFSGRSRLEIEAESPSEVLVFELG